MEPDLLIGAVDPEQSARWDELPEILRSCGYQRGGRDFQWEKQVGDVYVRLDLFRPEGTPTQATPMTELPRGEGRVLARASELRFRVRAREIKLKTPSPVDFVLMKLDAMRIRRPNKPKDAFDLYAYVRKKTPAAVGGAIAAAREREEVLERLHQAFAKENAAGVLDVLSFAASLEGIERELVARDAVRTFAELRRHAFAAAGDRPRSSASSSRLLTVGDVAERLGVCRASVYTLCAKGRLPHVKVLNAIRFSVDDVEAMIATARKGSRGDE